MPAPLEIQALVDKFKANDDYYTSSIYNETQTINEFIKPFFTQLGWDFENSKNVVVESRLYVEENGDERAKHPDIAFRVGNNIRFYVEAKKPSENLVKTRNAFQTRRYGWTQGLPLCVLTDFEEFIIYSCKIKPNKNDKPHIERLASYSYQEYIEKWDEIEQLFSYSAVENGSLENYVEIQNIFGSLSVDEAFLREMEGWRERLAKDVALHNRDLTRRELNIAVQRTIDRIVFLRICEDRKIEGYARLKSTVRNQDGEGYKRLKKIFIEADGKYNSGLFNFSDDAGDETADSVSMNIDIGDEPLRYIIYGMYYPDSPYEFSVLPSDILGQVYERFLGKVIELSDSGKADVVEKPEVRKAGGVYYTPTYIVDYIVENTVGKLLEGKNPKAVEGIRVLDPACGSGSFLIGAYQYLIDWHLKYYTERLNENENSSFKTRLKIINGSNQTYSLNTEEKKRILLNNIYGVDLDQQAVEVTKLSLLLKMLEGETSTTVPQQFHMFETKDRILPDLKDNIKWGNSLIGSDFYKPNTIHMFDDEDLYRVKAFDWDTQFASIMRDGGFDAVIGNPPYVRPHKIDKQDKEYFWKHFSTFIKKSDLYCCFIERGINVLKLGGFFGYIVSNSWLRLDSFENLRKFLLSNTSIQKLIDFSGNVFADATVKTTIVLLEKNKTNSPNSIGAIETPVVENLNNLPLRKIKQEYFNQTYKFIFDLSISEDNELIKNKMRKDTIQLGDLFSLSFGLKTGDDSRYLTFESNTENHKKLLRGENVQRYETNFVGEYVWYVPNDMKKHKKTARPGTKDRFEQAKILVRDTGDKLQCTFDDSNYYVKDVLIIADENENKNTLIYLTGLINSNLMRFYYETSFPTLHVQRNELASFPIRTIDFDKPDDKAKHDTMVALVQSMLDLHKQLPELSGQAKKVVEQQISKTDADIDALVYQLYDLTAEEIAIVEG